MSSFTSLDGDVHPDQQKSSAPFPLVFVSAHFPPATIAGIPRIRALIRYLPEDGFSLNVITVDDGSTLTEQLNARQILRLPYKDLRPDKSPIASKQSVPMWRRIIRDVVALPDRYVYWSKHAAQTAWGMARKYRCPIFVSVPPVSSAWALARYRRPGDPPLIVDFRDAWITDPNRADYYRNPLRQYFEHRMEELTIRQSATCFMASPGMLRSFQQRFPDYQQRFHLFLNGYDEAAWDQLPTLNSLTKDQFHILYSGSFPGYQTPEYVFRALSELSDPNIHLHILGDNTGKADSLIRTTYPQLTNQVSIYSRQEYAQCLARQQLADALLLIVTPGQSTDDTNMILTSKVFEYLRSGRPILATIPTEGDADRLLSRFSWVKRTSPTNVGEIKDALINAKDEWQTKAIICPEDYQNHITDLRRDVQIHNVAMQLQQFYSQPAKVA